MGYLFTQGNTVFNIPDTWILLDMCSTCNVIKNPILFKNIRECRSEERLTTYTNGGAQHYTQVADLLMLPLDIHFKQNSMANILSFRSVSEIKGARIVMDTSLETSIYVYLLNGCTYEFKQFSNGVYYFDTSVANNSTTISYQLFHVTNSKR